MNKNKVFYLKLNWWLRKSDRISQKQYIKNIKYIRIKFKENG
jgi:hypothetical protein